MLLLDTCILIWLSSKPQQFSARAANALNENADELHTSAICAWEVALGVLKGRLKLDAEPAPWFAQVVAKYKIQVIDVTWQNAAASAQLPRHHGDPADRIIIATALDRGLPILSPDEQMRQYEGVQVLWDV